MSTKEEIIRELLSDPLLVEKGYLQEGEYKKITLSHESDTILVELVKLVASKLFEEESENKITREVNSLLNKIK